MLIVDDDPTLLRAAGGAPSRAGYAVTSARSREEALALTGTYACGVFDIDLGDGNGVDLAEELLLQGRVDRVLFFSGATDDDACRRAELLGPLLPKTAGLGTLVLAVGVEIEEP